MVIDLVMVTPPNPPGSSTLISPDAAVLEMAPAKVLQGAVQLHGLASSPTPETHVRVACALAGLFAKARKPIKIKPKWKAIFFIVTPLGCGFFPSHSYQTFVP